MSDSAAAPLRPPADRLLPLWALLVGAAVFLCTWGSLVLFREMEHVAVIWPANAVVLAMLLRRPRRETALLLLSGFVGSWCADRMVGDGVLAAAALSAVNVVEILLCVTLIRRFIAGEVDLTRPRDLAVFGVAAGLAAPLASATLGALLLHLQRQAPILEVLPLWFAANALGMLTLTPALITLSSGGLRGLWRPARRLRTLALAGALLLVLLAVFGQSRVQLLFLVPPVLLLIAFHLGAAGAAAGVLVTAVATIFAAVMKVGPSEFGGGHTDQVLVEQLFLAVTVASTLPVAAIIAARARLEASLRGARREAEANERRYRLVAENATDIIVRVAPDGRNLYLSPSCFDATGYTPEELIGRRTIDLMPPEDAEVVRTAFVRMFRERLTRLEQSVQYRIRHKTEDRDIWLEANPTLLWNEQGEPVEFVDVVRDVSARKAIEAELAAAKAQAEAASAAKSDFLANMSHELRTPLTSIIGFSGLLALSAGLGAKERGYVDRVQTASEALLGVINDVLDYSKLEAQAVELEPLPFDLRGLIDDTVGLVAPQAEAKGLKVEAGVHPSAPERLVGDAGRLRQVLLNFLSNAVKFTPKGEISVIARAGGAAEGACRLTVSVVDSGIGVSAEKLDELFERFVQADGSITRQFGGTGLGLAISRRLIELMGGEIGAESRVGEGSTFWFSVELPIAEDAPAEPVVVTDTPLSEGGVRVLMVDDSEANRELVSTYLRALGVDVELACDGAEAVAAVKARDYDLVFMDVQMPVLDGLQATRTIRRLGARYQTLPIIALTANVLPEHVARCRGAGMDDHVGKPIAPARLTEALFRWLPAEAA